MLSIKLAGMALATMLALGACGDGAANSTPAGTPREAASVSEPAITAPAVGSESPADNGAVTAAVRSLFSTYLMSAEQMSYTDPTPVMDQDIYSTELSRVIAAWRTANPGPEPTEFTSVDWICQCQDWDAGRASVTIGAVTAREGGRYQVTASFNPGFEAPVTSTDFFMVNENGRWLVDDARFAATEPTMREILIAETRSPG